MSTVVVRPTGKLRDKFAELNGVYADDPAAFVRDVWGEWLVRGGGIQPWQDEFLKAVARGDRKISVRSGHKVGKTAACSWVAIWHILFRFPQKTLFTAPAGPQLDDVLLPELMMWIERLPPAYRACLECFSDRVELKKAPASSFISAKTSTKERPQAMAGMHSDNMLIICDEASEIHDEVFEAISGSMATEEARQILISNPTRLSGLFFRSHHGESHLWTRFHVPSTESRLVTPKWIAEQRDSLSANGFRRRVLGEFPTQEEDTLIAADLVEAAMARDIGLDPQMPLIFGVDVARKGKDRTALVKRRGNVVLECISWHRDDLMPTVGRIVAEARKDRPAEICVDSIGVGGGVADRLREIAREDRTLGFAVRDVNVAETEPMDPRVSRLRDGLWWKVKEWLEKKGCKLPADEELKADLVGPTYDYLSNGKVKVESKDDMRGRGLKSPDLGDALCLTFASMDAIVGGRGQGWGSRGKPLRRGVAVA